MKKNNNVTELVFILDRSGSISGLESDTIGGFNAMIEKQKKQDGSIHHIGNIHKYARPEDVPANTMFVITTDGMENASRRYSSEQVKKMIERQKEKYGWEFLFIGANIDAIETAARYGIDADHAVNYNADQKGTRIVYDTVADAVCNVRASRQLGAEWSKEIDKDYQQRGGRRGGIVARGNNVRLTWQRVVDKVKRLVFARVVED